MRRKHLIFTDGCVRWAFAKGVEQGGEYDGLHHILVVIGNAEDFADQSDDEIAACAVADMRNAMPGNTDEVTLNTAHVVRERRAASSPRLGGKRYRPYPSGDIANFFIAGDWASTGWPTSREGAVRSGYRAASALHEYCIEGTPSNASTHCSSPTSSPPPSTSRVRLSPTDHALSGNTGLSSLPSGPDGGAHNRRAAAHTH